MDAAIGLENRFHEIQQKVAQMHSNGEYANSKFTIVCALILLILGFLSRDTISTTLIISGLLVGIIACIAYYQFEKCTSDLDDVEALLISGQPEITILANQQQIEQYMKSTMWFIALVYGVRILNALLLSVIITLVMLVII